MRRIAVIAALSSLVPCAAPAADAGAPFLVDVEVVRDGGVSSATLDVPAGGSGSAVTERLIPYAAAAGPADAEDVASVVVGNSFRVRPVERDGGVSVSADIRISRLSGMRRIESGGRSVDFPDVDTVDLSVRDGAMHREGGSWVMERDDAASGARIRIVARR